MMVSFLSIALNLLFNWIFIFELKMGHRGLALSTALSATLNFGLLYFFMVRFAGALHFRELLSTFWRCGIATLPMIALVAFSSHWLEHLHGMHLITRVGGLLLIIALASGLFIAGCIFLKVKETSDFLVILERRWNRVRGS
jgi:putative peptidoglycan lipid II flippase